jgi:hypothetical protein
MPTIAWLLLSLSGVFLPSPYPPGQIRSPTMHAADMTSKDLENPATRERRLARWVRGLTLSFVRLLRKGHDRPRVNGATPLFRLIDAQCGVVSCLRDVPESIRWRRPVLVNFRKEAIATGYARLGRARVDAAIVGIGVNISRLAWTAIIAGRLWPIKPFQPVPRNGLRQPHRSTGFYRLGPRNTASPRDF